MTDAVMLCFIASIIAAAGTVLASEWKYDDQQRWASLCQEGKKQSPIPLSRSIAEEKEYHQFRLSGYGQTSKAILKNNGHSAEVRLNISEENRPVVMGGGLIGDYKLDHLHFHWHSEHTMEGYRFPLELHLVHYKTAFEDIPTALQHTHGVAVFAVLFELSPDDDEEFQPLLNIIERLQTKVNTPEPLQEFTVKNFLPRNMAGFYRYEGSLTTPGCNEGILWTVFTNTIPISAEQVRIFEEMKTNHNEDLRQNFRSLQPVNSRKVYVKISPIRNIYSAATTNLATIQLLCVALLVLRLTKY